MAQDMEPMDVDCMDSEFDNKENTYHHSNMLPCTEKGYEELDVSELNMKLRYSITPAASPMSKSLTTYDSKNLETDDLNCTIDKNLTRSLNSTMTKNDSVIKSLKTLPLQSLPTDHLDSRNSSVLRPLDTTLMDPTNITVTIIEANEIDENLSLPSTSSHTPEATTPVNDGGSPIMRGLKSVLNMFRPSQSPIPPVEGDSGNLEVSPSSNNTTPEKPVPLASTPIAAHRKKDGSSKKSSPMKDSIAFNDDLEKELQWKDETTIIFSQEKIPIHKLFFQNAKPTENITKSTNTGPSSENITQNAEHQARANDMNTTLEYMDVSYNDSAINDKTLSKTQEQDQIEVVIATESDGEFLDCETTFTNNDKPEKDQLLEADAPKIDILHNAIEKNENISKEEITKLQTELNTAHSITISQQNAHKEEVTNPEPEIKEDSNSTISIIQELDSLLKGNNSKKEASTNENNVNTTKTLENISEGTSETCKIENEQKEIILETTDIPENIFTKDFMRMNNASSKLKIVSAQATIEPEIEITKNSNQSDLTEPYLENYSIPVNDLNRMTHEITLNQVEIPADVPLPDEDDIDTDIIPNDAINATNILQPPPDVIDNAQTEITLTVAEHLEKSFTIHSEDNAIQMTLESVNINDNNQINQQSTGIKEAVLNTTQVISKTDEVMDSVNKIQETQCISNDAKAMDINKSMNEAITLPDLVNQTIPVDNASNTLDIKDEHNSESINDVKLVQDLLIQEAQNISNIKLPAKLEISASEINDLHSEIETIIDQAEDVANNTVNVADSTVSLDDQTVNTPNNITVETIDDKITTQDFNSTVIIDCDRIKEIVNKTVLLENSKDVTQNVLLTEYDAAQENGSISDKHTPIQNDEVNSTVIIDDGKETNNATIIIDENKDIANATVIIDDKKNTANASITIDHKDTENATVIIDDYNDTKNDTVIIDGDKNTPNDTAIIDKTCHITPEKNQVDTKMQPNIDSQSKAQNLEDIEEPHTDIEIIVSENNSPYVSVMAGIDTELKLEHNFDNFEFSRQDVPASPPIVSKGYNFNFDEIDDPFVTKSNIRQSPSPNTSSKDITVDLSKEPELPKKAPTNRRKSQPPERKRPTMHKKKLNTTIDVITKTTDVIEPEIETKDKSAESTPAPKRHDTNEVITEDNTDVKQCPEHFMKSEDKDTTIKIDEKSSCEPSSAKEVKTTSSSEQSYISAASSSTESFISKNVFNIPEIDNSNFNPFATKSKMRESPPLVVEENIFVTKSNSSVAIIEKIIDDVKDKMDVEKMEKAIVDMSAALSSKPDEQDITREVNTEDEDTEEGPFFEAEEVHVKTSIIANENREFDSLPTQNDNNLDSGEVFIDNEAYEFFLNQNQSHMVADSGRESLFVKFDPLFAKRISSDGVVAALKNVQKRQSTPTKTRPSLRNEFSPIAGPSNTTSEIDMNACQENNDEANITVAKPTMIVTPAVNPVVTPRNKSITPNRSNRRSVTFTSPAMAVIDRLISMSANNSLVDTSVTQPSRDQREAEAALSQLRELLAEKEIHVYNLRAENMLLKERLATMESQVKTIEDEGQNRLKKINELNSRLIEKSEINKRMAEVVEEYERTISSLIAETEQDKKRHAEERIQLMKERDEQTAHLANMEASFNDLHSKYEKSKQVILSFKANEETSKKTISDVEESYKKMLNNYETLKQHAASKLNHANLELEKMNKAHEAEVLKLNTLLKRKELHITSLAETLAQKTKANDELTAICDELINKVG